MADSVEMTGELDMSDSSVDPPLPAVCTLPRTDTDVTSSDHQGYTGYDQDVTTFAQGGHTETAKEEPAAAVPGSSPAPEQETQPDEVNVSPPPLADDVQQILYGSSSLSAGNDLIQQDYITSTFVDGIQQTQVTSAFTDDAQQTWATSACPDDVRQTSLTAAFSDDAGQFSVTSAASADDVGELTTLISSPSVRADDVEETPVVSSTSGSLVDVQETRVPSSASVHVDGIPQTTLTSSTLETKVSAENTNSQESGLFGTEEGSETMADTQIQAMSPPLPQQQQQQQAAQQVTPKSDEKAMCKYRWGKVVPTNTQRVIFFSSAHPKEPVFLQWSADNNAYYSKELQVPCGDYTGHVIVEGKTFSVEAFNVRTYTFEVDLFMKEDVIEDEVATSNTLVQELKFQQQQQQGPVDTYRDISTSALTSAPKMEENGESSIRHNKKYEDLLRQQLQHKDSLDASLESEMVMSQKSEHSVNGSGSKRLTPVGDIDKEPFQDGLSSLPMGVSGGFEPSHSGRSSGRHTPQNLYSGSASELRQDYDVDRHSLKSSDLNTSRHSLGEAPLGDASVAKSPSRPGSDFSGSLGSGRHTPQRELLENGSGSQTGSGRRTPVDSRIDVLGRPGSRSSPGRQTLTRETIDDVLGSETVLTSPVRSHTSGSARQTPDRELGLTGSAHSSARNTPLKEDISAGLLSSSERLFGSQELTSAGAEQRSLPGSRPASQPGSVSGSRPDSASGSRPGSQHASRTHSLTSLTSEQELSQFLDSNTSQPGSEPRRTPLNFDTRPDESLTLPPIMRERDRPTSLPTYSTQSPVGVDKRIFTPDNRMWSSAGGGEIGETSFERGLAGRLPPKSSASSASSRASSRTVTPVSANFDREDSVKVRDLEDTVATLRKLLSSREQEVHELTAQIRDLKDINHSLKKDLEHARSRRTPTGPDDLERQYQQLLQEKEILAAEVVKLRDRFESSKGTGMDSFSANSASTMQKRIEELESHIRDLRHTNDSTSQKMRRAEQRAKELLEENDKLRSSNSLHMQDQPDDRSGRYGDRRQQIEIQQLKEDVRTLRDRNYTLQEENLKLKDGRELPRSADFRTRESLRDLTGRNPMSSSIRSDDGVLPRHSTEASTLRDSGLQTSERSRSQHLPPPDQLPSPGRSGTRRQLDRSYGSDSFPTATSRDPLPHSRDRSFGSDHGTGDNIRESSSYSRSLLENGDKDRDRFGKYREFSADRGADLRRTDPGRYDLLRSRPDGEVSEKLHATDAGKYGTLSAEKLRSFDHEHERERGTVKLSMSVERLRILEEAERNRERRNLSAGSAPGHRSVTAENPSSSKDNARPKRSEANHSDDSDSTAVLMAYDVKGDSYSSQRERSEIKYGGHSRSQDLFYERSYRQEKEQDKERDRDYRDLRGSGYREANGDQDSDTATDILLNAEPGRPPSHSQSHCRRRRSSVGDDASVSSLSDGDEPSDSLRRRSKSVDTKGKKGPVRRSQTATLRTAASSEMLGGGKTVTLSSGFRSVTPQPLATQHNKHSILQQQASLSSSLTQGFRPFAPRSPGDVRIDDVVKFSRQGGKLSQGTVKFVGHLPGRSDVYLGVELYKEEGKHDGTFEGIRYFKCKTSKGVFVAFNKVVMAWAPN